MSNEITNENKDKKKILNEIKTIFVLENIYLRQNGIINSVFRKTKFMNDKWGYNPIILVSEYNTEIKRISLALSHGDYNENQTSLNRGTAIIGVYDYFQKSYSGDLDISVYKKSEDGMRYVEISPNVYEVYDGEELVKKEYFVGYNGALRFVERFENGKRKRAIFFDDYGYISKIRNYDENNDKYYPHENYYTTDRKLCIKAFYKYDDKANKQEDKNKLDKLIVYDDNGNVIRECADNADLTALCLEQLLDDSKYYMLVVEDGLYSKSVTSIMKKNVLKAIVVHNIFSTDPYDLKSKPQMYYKYLCENHSKFDGIVFLTHTERNDFIKCYGDLRNTFVIPHPYHGKVATVDFESRNHKKAVIISRFHSTKRINYAIDIFKIVVEKLPDVKLEIYGFGSEEDNYREQIKRLDLEKNVFIRGFTNDPISIFSSVAVSLSASSVEGFGLAILESVCSGCPVLSFDVKYGPSDIIKDGETGFLFPYGDNYRFAQQLISYFENEEMQRRMSENAYKDADRFSSEIFLDKWYNLMETLYKRR